MGTRPGGPSNPFETDQVAYIRTEVIHTEPYDITPDDLNREQQLPPVEELPNDMTTPEEPNADEPLTDEPDREGDVPVGTVQEVLEWVGTDKFRAEVALEAEGNQEKPRKTLVDKLEEILDI